MKAVDIRRGRRSGEDEGEDGARMTDRGLAAGTPVRTEARIAGLSLAKWTKKDDVEDVQQERRRAGFMRESGIEI